MRIPKVVVGTVAVVLCLSVLVVGLGFRKLERQDAAIGALIHQDEVEDEVDDAQRCVTSWETRHDLRRADKAAGLAGAEALIQVTGEIAEARGSTPTPPEFLERYRVVLAERLTQAGTIIEDPDCDRERAQRVLDDPAYADALATDDNQ